LSVLQIFPFVFGELDIRSTALSGRHFCPIFLLCFLVSVGIATSGAYLLEGRKRGKKDILKGGQASQSENGGNFSSLEDPRGTSTSSVRKYRRLFYSGPAASGATVNLEMRLSRSLASMATAIGLDLSSTGTLQPSILCSEILRLTNCQTLSNQLPGRLPLIW